MRLWYSKTQPKGLFVRARRNNELFPIKGQMNENASNWQVSVRKSTSSTLLYLYYLIPKYSLFGINMPGLIIKSGCIFSFCETLTIFRVMH